MSDAPVITYKGYLYRVDGENVTRVSRTNLKALVPIIVETPVEEWKRRQVLAFYNSGRHRTRRKFSSNFNRRGNWAMSDGFEEAAA
jgi:hypothetical protein